MSRPHLNNVKSRRGNNDWLKIIRLGDNISAQASINLHCDRIILTAEEIFTGYACLWLSEAAFSSTLAGLSPKFDIQYQTGCSPLMEQAAKKRKILSRQVTMGDGIFYTIAAPMIIAGEILGVLHIERQSTKFSGSERKLLSGLTTQAANMLDTARKHILDQWSVELLELVRNVGQQITEVMDGDELARRVTQLIQEQFKYYYVAVFTLVPDSNTLRFRDSAGPTDDIALAPGRTKNIQINIGEGIIGHVAKTGMELLENSAASSLYYRHLDALPETKAEFSLPLKMGDQIIGVLDVQSDIENSFHEMDILVLRALADHIAVAITNSNLYSDVSQRANQLATVAGISKAVSSILDFDHLLNNIVTLIHRHFSVPTVNLYLTNWGRNQIVFRASAGTQSISADLRLNEFAYDIDSPTGLVPWAVQNQQSALVNDVAADKRFQISAGSPSEIRSELVIPLSFGDKVLGVLDLQSPQVGSFKRDDIYILEALADYISVAIRNANLYSTELWRRSVSESIREVAGLLSADIELDKVLDRILQELYKTLPCDVSAIWLLEDHETDVGIGQYTSPLRLASIYSEGDAQEDGSQVIDTENLHELLQMSDLPGSLSPWMLEALEADSPLVRSSTSPYEPIGSYLNFQPDYSAIAAPLRTGDLTLGLLVLIHHRSGRYGHESQAMTATYASYSAVAIKNTRLYEAAHDQAWVATVLLQVAEATQSVTSMQELLETVVRIIPRLIGVKSCVLFSWDVSTEAFIPETYDSLEENQAKEFPVWQVFPGEIPAFDQVLENKTPVIIDRSNFPFGSVNHKFASLNVENELLGLFPMVSQNNILGAILINFSPNEASTLTSYELWEEKFTIVQGIANQTAVAVENIRLLQTQEEEAYISVALLQVAQAVVSLNDLDEILGTIVRITPILVGVKRSVIYLCDPVNKEFHLSQSYGIPRQELAILPQSYAYDEHTLLNAVRESGSVVIKKQPGNDESPIMWATYAQNDFSLSPTPLNTNGELSFGDNIEPLRYRGSLLFGFPLVIKGDVLGVMITEEAETPKGAPALHIRERRLEIITGIIQQAALAIQNDRFQKEVVDRERLTREMQLAREIQTTFLPESIPNIDGWDLDIRWRPARQVGGDFYDLINMPDGRICLVMADVADKGMPAALFMTLVRTLIRAATKDHSSPAAILMQVNDLLVPDSKQGMFVTVLVAIIAPVDGIIFYANAGHNPPIVHRKVDGSMIELLPTGMALGVIEGIEIGEQRVNIEPGDKLVVYTDGVTEAFSTHDEIFGVDRLKRAIKNYRGSSARKQLDRIEAAIKEFVEDASPSDDLTLAAFIRQVSK